jgi:hypothetical protein
MSGTEPSIRAILKASFRAIKDDIQSLKANQELQINGVQDVRNELNQMKDSFVHKSELKKELTEFNRDNVQTLGFELDELKKTNGQLVNAMNARIKALNDQFMDIEQMKKELAGKIRLIDSFDGRLKMLERNMNDNFSSVNKKMATEAQIRKLVEDLNEELDRMKESNVTKKEFDRRIEKIEKKL